MRQNGTSVEGSENLHSQQNDIDEIQQLGQSSFTLPQIGFSHRVKQTQNDFGAIKSKSRLRNEHLSKGHSSPLEV